VLAATAGTASAQRPGKIPRVGVLHVGSAKEPAPVQRNPFERGLRELGWIPGSSVVIDYRYAEGNAAKLAEHAGSLVGAGADVIVARGAAAIEAARQASSTIPIVMSATNDPVNEGFVTNLSQPGGNITGIAMLVFELDGKRLELLREVFPNVSRVAVLANPHADVARYDERISALQSSARSLKMQLVMFEVRRMEELASAFAAISQARVDALLARADPQVIDLKRSEIVAIAAKLRLPAIYPWRFFAEAGGLISYGPSLPGFHHRSATYVSRILKGAKPGDLAIEQPTTFELVVNLKTAKALGIELPKALLFRADELIQ
jgi:putative ABC transport system substrate-binding protein